MKQIRLKITFRRTSFSTLIFGTMILGLCFLGCSSHPKKENYETPKATQIDYKKPKLAVALGGGGVKGYVHIGAIKALEEAGIQPDLITGVSIGSLAGALWASGMKAEEIESLAKKIENGDVFDWSIFRSGGWIKGQKYEDLVRKALQSARFEQLKTPLIVVAAELGSGNKVSFNSGDVAQAVRASSSVAGIFIPTKIDSTEYLDGDYVGTVPVTAAQEAGAQIIFAVDITSAVSPLYSRSSDAIRDHTYEILRKHQVELELKSAQFSIRPLADQPFSLRKMMGRQELISLGYQETLKVIPSLKARLETINPDQSLVSK